MTEDTDRLIATALEPEPRLPDGAIWGGVGIRSVGGMWDFWGAYAGDWLPRPFSTDDYAAFDALKRFAEADQTHRVHHHICEREHYIHLHGGHVRGWRFDAGWGSFASAASDALVQWVRSRE